MSHHRTPAEIIAVVVILGAGLLIRLLIAQTSLKRLGDPEDDRALPIDDVLGKARLAPYGRYEIRLLRQSGYLHAVRHIDGSATEAINSALATFRRAGVPVVNVLRNDRGQLSVTRIVEDRSGRAAGKKVARALVTCEAERETPAAANPPAPDPVASETGSLRPKHQLNGRLTATCSDCGTATTFAIGEIDEPHRCQGCGDEIAIPVERRDAIKKAAVEAAYDLQRRMAAGEEHPAASFEFGTIKAPIALPADARSPAEDGDLDTLVRRLEATEPLSAERASTLWRAHLDRTLEKAMARMEATGDARSVATVANEERGDLAILNQPEADFHAELRSIDNDLPRQVSIVNEGFDHWFCQGMIVPPYYAWRIAIILAKAKRMDEEKAFLAAWCRHFGHVAGGRFGALAERARKRGLVV